MSEGPPRFSTAARETDLQIVGEQVVAHSEDEFSLNKYMQTFLIAVPQFTDLSLFTEWGSG